MGNRSLARVRFGSNLMFLFVLNLVKNCSMKCMYTGSWYEIHFLLWVLVKSVCISLLWIIAALMAGWMRSTLLGNTKLFFWWPHQRSLPLPALTHTYPCRPLFFCTFLWSKRVSFCSLQLIWTTLSSQLIGLPWSSAESRRPCAVCPHGLPHGF